MNPSRERKACSECPSPCFEPTWSSKRCTIEQDLFAVAAHQHPVRLWFHPCLQHRRIDQIGESVVNQDRYMSRGRVHTQVADLLDRTICINDE